MSVLKRLASDTAVYGISSILSRLINYVVMTPFLTRLFAPEEFGVVTDLFVYAGFLTLLFTYRMDTAFFRFGRNEADRDRVFATSLLAILATSVVLAVSLFLFSDVLARAMYYGNHAEYLWWLAGIVGFDALCMIPFARLRLENKPFRFAGIKLINILINTITLVFFLKILPDALKSNSSSWLLQLPQPTSRVSYVFIANLLASGVTLLLLSPVFATINWRFDTKIFREMCKYALPLLVVSIAGMINEVLDRTLLKFLLEGNVQERMAQVGIYSACYKLPTLMMIFTTAYNYAAEPLFFSHADRSDAPTLYARSAHAYFLVAAVGMLGILLFTDTILLQLIGKDFRGGLAIVPILLLANLFFGLYNNFSIWYKLKDKTSVGSYIAIGGAVITLIINVLFIPKFGYMASAYATLLCYGFQCVATYWLGQQHYPVAYPIRRMAFYVAAVFGLYFIHHIIKINIANIDNAAFATQLIANFTLFILFIIIIFYFERIRAGGLFYNLKKA